MKDRNMDFRIANFVVSDKTGMAQTAFKKAAGKPKF
jgi:hypothetical protein